MMLIRFKLLTFALFFISYCWLGAVRKGLPPNDGGAIRRLPQALEVKTLSLNPEYCVFGLPAKGGGGKLPMLIYLHGAGGVGSDINKARRQASSLVGPLKQAKIASLVVAPQATKSPRREGAKAGWQVGDLDILLGHLLKSLPADPDRVYLTGNSMGGYGTFMWAGYSPQHFAAIAPMVGGLGPLGPKDVTKDGVVPADRGEMILKEITKAGGKQAKVIVLPDMGHNAGKVPHGDPDFYKWLYGNKRQRK